MTLEEAWKDRKVQWNQGTKLIEEGNRLWKELATMPATGAVRVGVWFELSEMAREAAQKVHQGYALRAEADAIWHDTILDLQGSKTKLIWAFDDQAKAYDCRLDSGEEFKA